MEAKHTLVAEISNTTCSRTASILSSKISNLVFSKALSFLQCGSYSLKDI